MLFLLCTPLPRPTDYASPTSWNDAYASDQWRDIESDWLLAYDGDDGDSLLQRALMVRLPRGGRLLELGCGSSPLAAQLCCDGCYDVLATDSSPVVIEEQRKRHQALLGRGLAFEVADARDTKLETGTFASVVDKGLLDAVLCSEGFDYEAGRVRAEVARVLAAGGVWVSISLSPPKMVLPLITHDDWAALGAEPLGGVYCYTASKR